jgi:hypothetical protein
VKVALAVSPGTVLVSRPDAVTVFAPVDDGTTKVQEKAPVLEVVWPVQVCVVGVEPA